MDRRGEPPDFDKLARILLHPVQHGMSGATLHEALLPIVREALVNAWNFRGVADAQAVDDKLATLTGWVTSEPYRQHLREAITALDYAPIAKA